MLLLGVLAYVAVSLDLCDQIAVFSRGGGGIANSLNLIMYDLSTHRHIQYYTSMWDLSTKHTSIWDAFGSGLGRPLVAACERPQPPPARTPGARPTYILLSISLSTRLFKSFEKQTFITRPPWPSTGATHKYSFLHLPLTKFYLNKSA